VPSAVERVRKVFSFLARTLSDCALGMRTSLENRDPAPLKLGAIYVSQLIIAIFLQVYN